MKVEEEQIKEERETYKASILELTKYSLSLKICIVRYVIFLEQTMKAWGDLDIL